MIKLSIIFASFGLIGIGYFISDGSLAGQISCGIISFGGYASAIAWNELNKHEERLENDGRSKKRV
jgi:hypothetical protein